MSPLAVFLSVLFFFLLGGAYCKGYDLTKKLKPEKLPQFYMIMAAIRFLLVLTVVGIYVTFSNDKADKVNFAAMFFLMYLIMMIVPLKLKH